MSNDLAVIIVGGVVTRLCDCQVCGGERHAMPSQEGPEGLNSLTNRDSQHIVDAHTWVCRARPAWRACASGVRLQTRARAGAFAREVVSSLQCGHWGADQPECESHLGASARAGGLTGSDLGVARECHLRRGEAHRGTA